MKNKLEKRRKLFKPIFYCFIMVKGLSYYLRLAWRKPDNETLKERMIGWRNSEATVVVDKPLRLDRARALGYRDKKGFVVIRVRVIRGGHKRTRPNKGRRSKRLTIRKNLKMSYKWIAENRVSNSYKNLEVLNSYQIGKDGQHYFFEVICVDPSKAEIQNDKKINWICKGQNQNRPERGITSAGRKSRGLKSKHPTSKVRPSVRAGKRLGK
jgi:large subunit ribosomal protein L15e